MPLPLIFASLASLLLCIGGSALAIAWARSLGAYLNFKKKLKGIPMLEGRHAIGNHLLTFAYGKDNCNLALATHERLGKNFGWLFGTTPAVSTVDLDLIKTIVKDESHVHVNRARPHMPIEEVDQSIFYLEDDEWLKVRQILSAALKSAKFKRPKILGQIEGSVGELLGLIERKLTRMAEEKGESRLINGQDTQFDLYDLMHRFTLNVTFGTFYNQPKLINFDDEPCEWTEKMEKGLSEVQTSLIFKSASIFPWLKPIIDWAMYHFFPFGQYRKSFLTLIKEQAEESKRQAKKVGALSGGSLLDPVIQKHLEGRLTTREFLNSSAILLATAENTASDCLVHSLYLLSVDPVRQEKLRESLTLKGTDSEYLEWTLRESLRLLPPAPIACSRVVKRDIRTSDDQLIPAGTYVNTCAYVIHRLKEYWGEDAEEFRPERWQDASRHHPMQYIPFGAGCRVCPGQDFAMHEMKALLAALLVRYRFSGGLKRDAYKFDSPFQIYILPCSPTYVTIERIQVDPPK